MKKHQKDRLIHSVTKPGFTAFKCIIAVSIGCISSTVFGQTFQAENLTVTASGTDKFENVTSLGMTYTQFNPPPANASPANPHWLQFALPGSLGSGVYNLEVGYKTGNNRGICQISVSNDNGNSFSDVGSAFNEYAPVATGDGTPMAVNLNGIMIPNGTTYLRITTTSKTSYSSAYGVTVDYFSFTLVPSPAASWIGTTDGLLYVSPATAKIGIGTTHPTMPLEIADNAGNHIQCSPTLISLGQDGPGSGPRTNIFRGHIDLFNGLGLHLYSSETVSSADIGLGTITVNAAGAGGTTIRGGTINAITEGGSINISPVGISLTQSNPGPGASPRTYIYQGKIELVNGNIHLSGTETSSNADIGLGTITVTAAGSGGTTIWGGTVTVESPGNANPTIIKGNSITTDVVYVGTKGWSITAPDYVFGKDFALMPLSKVEKFVKENGHLPEMPSAVEMEKGKTVNLVELNMKLLKKIEELTLHSIAMEKRATDQEKRIRMLERKNVAE